MRTKIELMTIPHFPLVLTLRKSKYEKFNASVIFTRNCALRKLQ